MQYVRVILTIADLWLILASHVSIYRPVLRNAGSPLAHASEPLTGESGATSTTRRPEAWASAAKTSPGRIALLDRRPPILVRMATIPHCGQARNRGALAQGRIPFVREADLQGQEARRETTDVEASPGIDFPDGRRQPHVGSASYPSRAPHARF